MTADAASRPRWRTNSPGTPAELAVSNVTLRGGNVSRVADSNRRRCCPTGSPAWNARFTVARRAARRTNAMIFCPADSAAKSPARLAPFIPL